MRTMALVLMVGRIWIVMKDALRHAEGEAVGTVSAKKRSRGFPCTCMLNLRSRKILCYQPFPIGRTPFAHGHHFTLSWLPAFMLYGACCGDVSAFINTNFGALEFHWVSS